MAQRSFKTAKDPILVWVLGHNPFGSVLEEVIHGKSIEGRGVEFRQVTDAEQANSCQILFVSAAENKRYRSLKGDLKPAGLLTIGETQGFQTREKVLDVGPIHATRDKEHNVPYGPLAGGLLAIGGVVLLVKSKE